MDLNLTSQEQAFREEVIRFLETALTPELVRAGRLMTSIFSDFDASIQWQKILHEKGWAGVDWPEAYGGTGWSLVQRNIFNEESRKRGAPSLFPMGLQMLGPILIRYGSEEQKATLLPRILSAEDIWCQGYSEPNAGSDLASLQMKAKREGDEYILNGSKIWTSYAHKANRMFCLVRTRQNGKPQAGISFVLVDMDSPGITVDPIVSLDGEVEQCQVFFDDVRIPVSQRVGEENQGWEIAKYLLEFERGGYSYYVALNKQFDAVLKAARVAHTSDGSPFSEDACFMEKISRYRIEAMALEFLEHRIKAKVAAGEQVGALTSIPKLVGTELSQKMDHCALELSGPRVAVRQNEALRPDYRGEVIGLSECLTFANAYLNNRASTIYGGSAQIQRNIIARMVMQELGT